MLDIASQLGSLLARCDKLDSFSMQYVNNYDFLQVRFLMRIWDIL